MKSSTRQLTLPPPSAACVHVVEQRRVVHAQNVEFVARRSSVMDEDMRSHFLLCANGGVEAGRGRMFHAHSIHTFHQRDF
jgi:hypothetical protein